MSFLQDSLGITPLIALSAHEAPEMVSQLVSIGADMEMKLNMFPYKTALDIATERGNSETAALLQNLAGTPMDEEQRQANRQNLLKYVLGEDLRGMNSEEHVVHNKYRMWSSVSSINCQISSDGNTWGINANNIYCVKDCSGFDRATDLPFINKIGMTRTLKERVGYVWHDANGKVISSVKCLIRDKGGFGVVSYEEYHTSVALNYPPPIMITPGARGPPFRPHFITLSPKDHPLPSCLKQNSYGSAVESSDSAALFMGQGTVYI